jgi:hypothetical protein
VTRVELLHKQLTKPACLRHVVVHGVVLWLNTQTGDDIWTLQGLGDEIVTQKYLVARSGPVSVGTPYLVSVSG